MYSLGIPIIEYNIRRVNDTYFTRIDEGHVVEIEHILNLVLGVKIPKH